VFSNRPVLILGASTRAAAQSAVRAGFAPVCADMFSDCDLAECARMLEVAEYPHGLVAAAASAPPMPWIYTGGLENHPRIVEEISRSRPLWGNGGDVLRRIRDPWHVAGLLVDHGLPACRFWPRDAAPPAADGIWMLKPLRGAAGRGIRVWENSGSDPAPLQERHYFQERRLGSPISALFLAQPQQTTLLGITRQLVGLPEVHAPPYAWCGTITPVELPVEISEMVQRIGIVLAQRTGLRGLFGCDFIVGSGQPWLTEVNPRYPASTELVERVLRVPLLDWHRRACESFDDPGRLLDIPDVVASARGHAASVLGKIVLYANRDLAAPDARHFLWRPPKRDGTIDSRDTLPYMADIAAAGTRISRGQPICTLYARAAREGECLAKLMRRARRFEAECQ
jgi:predicted ATP-grasp superfamily ATP-dependent carboligase